VSHVRTLPAVDYVSPDVHEQERHAIFGTEWLCLGLSADLRAPGSYIADTVAGWPLLVVRDLEGSLRAFHNVCRHRAGPLVDDGGGSCRSLVCRYHGWAYGLDGSLRSARDSGLDTADIDGLDLLTVQVAEWCGVLFVCLDPDAPPLPDWLGDMAAECEPFPIETWQPAGRTMHVIDCNWKTYGDNYLEGYHIPLVHPALSRAIDPSSYRVEVHDGWVRHRAATREDALATGAWLWHWPNMAINLYESGMSVERWYPTGPTTCVLLLDYSFADNEGTAAGRNRMDVDASMRICEEDKAICEAVQRNLTAGVYVTGLLSPRHELGVADFHRRVLAARETLTERS
jgi:choline monooxygenase